MEVTVASGIHSYSQAEPAEVPEFPPSSSISSSIVSTTAGIQADRPSPPWAVVASSACKQTKQLHRQLPFDGWHSLEPPRRSANTFMRERHNSREGE